jgi:hypothetical protein
MVTDDPLTPVPATMVARARIGQCDYEMWLSAHPVDGRTAVQEFEYRTSADGHLYSRERVTRTVFRNTRSEVAGELAELGFHELPERPEEWPPDFFVARLGLLRQE